MDVSHSVWYDTAMIFLRNRTNFKLGDKILPVFQHGFHRSEENVNLNNFLHLEVYQCLSSLEQSKKHYT